MNDTDIEQRTRWQWMPKIVKAWIAIPSAVIDGATVFLIAVLTTLSTAFSQDDAYKYVNVYIVFWVKICAGSLASGLVAFQSFRNRSYSDYLNNKKPNT